MPTKGSPVRLSHSLGQFGIKAVPGGRPRTLVCADDAGQAHRHGFALANGRFYFPRINRTADVWVAEATREVVHPRSSSERDCGGQDHFLFTDRGHIHR
jgi:hypothetical protein